MRSSSTAYGKRYSLDRTGVYLYTLFACLCCWGIGYINSVGFPVYGEVTAPPLWNAICHILSDKLMTYLIGFILMLGGAFMLHRANYVLVLIREKTVLVFLIYTLLLSTNPDFFPLKATTVAVFCMVFVIYLLFTSYHNPEAIEKAFNWSLIIGAGSLLWIHLLWFVPLCWIGMFKFRTLTLKTFLASLLGLTTIYWFVLGWCIWQNDFTAFTIPFTALFKVRFLSITGIEWMDWASIILILILTITSVLNIVAHEHDDTLRTRQFLSFLTLFVIWSFGLFFLYEQASEEFLEISCMPMSVLLAHYFTVSRNRYNFWLYHLFVLLLTSFLIIRLWSF
ncbi:hypothetical protein [Parabacteroides sp. PF5-9]|uniref:hypothetical protein n=1 Tax=Parabacteroides sp. PF5-9 TaxID=1742404 RepID=UPI002472FB96|nr:hypothetical protein [Parabacteroides sp. PF5-9]MDH6358408.1 hypothetical protein [Parabacteroides sp. PF5-9]